MAFAAPGNLANISSSTLDWPQKKPKSRNSHLCNICLALPKAINSCIRNISNGKFVFSCSTKPNIGTDNNENHTNLDVGSSSRIQQQSNSGGTGNPVLSSSSSSNTKGLIFNLGCKNSWDSFEIGSPVVKRFLGDEEERWYMWYHGKSNESETPSNDSIGLAISRNGIHWERGRNVVESSSDVGLVLNCNVDWWAFDTQNIRPSEIVIMSSSKVKVNNALYWLYYTGFSSEKIDLNGFNVENLMRFRNGFDFKSLPGLAMSQDGRHWARIEGEHHSGALFDVGVNREWDSLFIDSAQVVFNGSGDLRMYYHSFDIEKGHFCIGIARSRDGIKWMKLGKILGGGTKGTFDELGVMNPQVVRNQKHGNYVMIYEGVGVNGDRSIGLAVSSNGLNDWRRYKECPVLKQCEEDGWDCEGVGSPYLVQMDDTDEWRLYYVGSGNGGKMGIGLAVSQGSEFGKFERWNGFQFVSS